MLIVIALFLICIVYNIYSYTKSISNQIIMKLTKDFIVEMTFNE